MTTEGILTETTHFWFKSYVKHQMTQSVSHLRNASSCFLLACINNIFSNGRLRISNSSISSKDDFWMFWGCFCGIWEWKREQKHKEIMSHNILRLIFRKAWQSTWLSLLYILIFLKEAIIVPASLNTLASIITRSLFHCLS